MALELQQLANRGLGAIADVKRQNNETRAKVASIVIGALTGGVGGALSAYADAAGAGGGGNISRAISGGPSDNDIAQANYDKTLAQTERYKAQTENVRSQTYARDQKTNRLSAQEASQRAQASMKNSQDEKRNKVSLYGAKGEVING